MKISMKELMRGLERTFPAVTMSGAAPEFSRFLFNKNTITATDGTMVITTQLSEDTGLECSVPGAPFIELLRGLREKEVSLEIKENDLLVKTNVIEGAFVTYPLYTHFTIPDLADFFVNYKLEDFKEGLKFCRYSASRDRAADFYGIKVFEDKMYGTDNNRITRAKLRDPLSLIKPSILTVKYAFVLLKFLDDINSVIQPSEKFFVTVLTDGTTISTTTIPHEYPDLDPCFPSEENCMEVIFSEDTQSTFDTIDRHIKFLSGVDEGDMFTEVKVMKRKCILESLSKDYGVLKEEMKIKSTSDRHFQFLVNPLFLKEISQVCKSFYHYPEKFIIRFSTDTVDYLVMEVE